MQRNDDHSTADAYAHALDRLGAIAHANSVAHGFWEDPPATAKDLLNEDIAKLCLMHSELSEALEGMRAGNPPSEHIPEYTAVEEEIADVLIRLLGYCHARGHRIGEAVIAKMTYNHDRPRLHGGKRC